MYKKILLAGLLVSSFSANAAILSIDSSFGADTITRDTDTGLDWLDLTETIGRSYREISGLLGPTQEFAGYRYAHVDEVQQLWKNFGFTYGTNQAVGVSDQAQFAAFNDAVTHLGYMLIGVIIGTLGILVTAMGPIR